MIAPRVGREDGWILFDAPLPGAVLRGRSSEDFDETLLRWSAALPGGCKFALAPGSAGLRVRAELPVLGGDEEEARLTAAQAGFAAAAERLGLGPAPASDETPSGSPPDLAGLCAEAGWPCDPRADGSLAVDLGGPRSNLPATVRHGERGIVVEAEIAPWPAAGESCRAALCALLLRVNGAFRMARAVLRPGTSGSLGAGEGSAWLEVPLLAAARAGELGEALGALTVAAGRCALEARLLAEEAQVARFFLRQSGLRATQSMELEASRFA